jgi:flagellar biosynthetic protein FliQ
MTPQDAVDLARQAVLLVLLVCTPVLAAGLLIGLLIGLLQAVTQIQEQTVAFVPKLIAMMVVLLLTLPWVLVQLIEYTRDVIRNIPELL